MTDCGSLPFSKANGRLPIGSDYVLQKNFCRLKNTWSTSEKLKTSCFSVPVNLRVCIMDAQCKRKQATASVNHPRFPRHILSRFWKHMRAATSSAKAIASKPLIQADIQEVLLYGR